MIIATILSGVASLIWLAFFGYVVFVIVSRARGKETKISITVSAVILIIAVIVSALASSIIVIDAGEVGVVFNAFTGTQEHTLRSGMHIVLPYINEIYRYTTREQVYTMSEKVAEGQVEGDDSLWSPTKEGLQVGIDSSTRYAINPVEAYKVHERYRHTYEEVLIRPAIRSFVRLHVSQNTVTDVYGPRRKEIQTSIEDELRVRLEEAGFILLSFDIRNVNFTPEYETSIEKKQIAQQEAEQMQYVLQRQQSEAERIRIEAEGVKQAAITEAQGEAESLRLINEALAENPNLLLYRYVEKLTPGIRVMMVPSNAPFMLNLEDMMAGVQVEPGQFSTGATVPITDTE